MAALAAADVDAAIRVRAGLSRLRARAAEAARGAALGARVVYVGGSVTAQRDGWRPVFHSWLCRAIPAPLGHEACVAAMGNCGSKVLAFTAHEWVSTSCRHQRRNLTHTHARRFQVFPPHERPPDLVILEAAINDGDSVVETGDSTGVRRAIEGIVRGILTAAPHCEIMLVFAHLRTDLPQLRRSGTLAWVNDDTGSAARIYRDDVPAIHEQVAEHYGLATVNVTRALRSLPSSTLDALYRDDCHTTPAGAAVMASVVAACMQRCLAADASPPRSVLVPPLDPLHWAAGRTRPVTQADLKLSLCADGTPTFTTRVWDVDPLSGSRGQWWLLAPGDDALHIEFEGTALALLTHQGPDSGVLRVVVTSAGRENAKTTTTRVNLFDQHCYYYRLSVTLLATGLPPGRHTAHVTLLSSPPDRGIAKRPLQPTVAGQLRLWLSHVLVMGSAAHASRAITHEGAVELTAVSLCDQPVALQRQPLQA